MARRQAFPPARWLEDCSGHVGIWLLRAVARLPLPVLQRIGRWLGRCAFYLLPIRQRIARVNLQICFPEVSAAARRDLLLRHYESMGMGIFELGAGWYKSGGELLRHVELTGLENVLAVQASGRGALMLTAHFTTLEICGRMLNEHFPFSCLYRKPNHPVIAREMTAVRRRIMRRVIHRDEMNDLIRALRDGEFVWYAPDQGQKIKYSALLPFFGEPATTNTATGRIARMGKAAVIPFVGYRLPNGRYRIEILPEMDGIPSKNPQADALRINSVIEDFIRKAPDQYFWLHRKFKRRGDDYADVYANS